MSPELSSLDEAKRQPQCSAAAQGGEAERGAAFRSQNQWQDGNNTELSHGMSDWAVGSVPILLGWPELAS